jgi:aspartyl-tRNA(Asn)/glutamyl-tRNA(Gln) amidotransferase subunit A
MTKSGASSPDPLRWSLAELSGALRERRASPVEVTRLLLERVDSLNEELNAYVTVLSEEALAAAARAEREISTGDLRGPLHGVPVALKDIIFTRGVRTTMGSEFFRDYVPDYDAAVVERLRQAGAIIVGKPNTHEFAYGPTGDRSYFGPVKNPYDTDRISGGSSSGSGAAVAACMSFAALGTDTGGSVRIPASCCGVVGMKPTFGRVSKYGVFPLSWTLDHVGPLTRTVEDNALVLGAISGYDARDPYSASRDAEDFAARLGEGVRGSVIGVPSSFYFERVEAEVEEKVRQGIEALRDLGAVVREVEIPHLEEALAAQRITLAVEAFAVHEERLRTRPKGFDEEVRERLLTGEDVKAYEYARAQQTKLLAGAEFERALEEVDALLSPTLPILPTAIGEREVEVGGRREHVRAALTRFMGPTNLNGLPSLSVPCGLSTSGLPVGLQIMGRPFDEANLYRFGRALERAIPVSTPEARE